MTRHPVRRYTRASPNRCGCPRCLDSGASRLDEIVAEHSAFAAYERASGEVVVKRISFIDPKAGGGR